MGDYKQLEVWQLAHVLTLSVYRVTRLFPRDELYGLSAQLRRAAVSVESNIADLGYRGAEAWAEVDAVAQRVSRMLIGLINALRAGTSRRRPRPRP
jgi:23S rRNA-intervening sequence protein